MKTWRVYLKMGEPVDIDADWACYAESCTPWGEGSEELQEPALLLGRDTEGLWKPTQKHPTKRVEHVEIFRWSEIVGYRSL